MNIVLTYGTFDLFHVGHVRLLERAKSLGDKLIVGVSTDEFNALKGKRSVFSFEARREIVGACRYVDQVIPEVDWSQKSEDVTKLGVQTFVMGHDWMGKFDFLKNQCKVVYLDRTENISSTGVREAIKTLSAAHINKLKDALDAASSVISELQQ